MSLRIWLGLLSVGLCGLVSAGFVRTQVGSSSVSRLESACARIFVDPPSSDPAARLEARQLVQRGKISAAIGRAGYAELLMPFPHGVVDEIAPFVRASSLIVDGVISTEPLCSVTADDRWVVSAYELTIRDVLKGGKSPGDKIIVLVNGGRVIFPDRTWAQIRFQQLIMPEAGQRFIFLLIPSAFAAGDSLAARSAMVGAYQMTKVGYGGFRVDQNGIARSMVDYTGRPRQGRSIIFEYDGKPVSTLLTDVKKTQRVYVEHIRGAP